MAMPKGVWDVGLRGITGFNGVAFSPLSPFMFINMTNEGDDDE